MFMLVQDWLNESWPTCRADIGKLVWVMGKWGTDAIEDRREVLVERKKSWVVWVVTISRRYEK